MDLMRELMDCGPAKTLMVLVRRTPWLEQLIIESDSARLHRASGPKVTGEWAT